MQLIIENRLNHILVTMTTMFEVQIRNITIDTLDYLYDYKVVRNDIITTQQIIFIVCIALSASKYPVER